MSAKRRNRFLTAALRYAERGWLVHPLRDKRKAPRLTEWPDRASTDPQCIRNWWKQYPNTNVGIVTGRCSNLLVIDVDNKGGKDGKVTIRQLEDELGPLPSTLEARTPNGIHYYFSSPSFAVPNSASRLGPGLDVRSDRGYVVAPPSSVGGKTYRWANELEPAQLPEAWLTLLTSKPSIGSRIIEEGSRDDTIFREACSLRARNVPVNEAWERLLEFNRLFCSPPLEERQITKCLRSAWSNYPPGYLPNDLGNAQRFVDKFGDRVRYVVELRTFIVWDGNRWQVDTDDLGSLALMKVANRRIGDEVRDCSDPEVQKRLAKYAVRAFDTNRLKLSLESVKSEPGVKIHIQELDADPYLLGVENGVIDLRSGEWYPGRKGDLITKTAGCSYVEGAQCPLWLEFLDRVMGSNSAMTGYLQRIVGYSLTGLTGHQILFFVFGSGANGKTVFLEIIKKLLGDYARTMRTEVLMTGSRGKGGPSEDEARLVGSRFVTVNETAAGMKFNEALIKDLTGGDTITARPLYKKSFEFIPQFKLWMRGNHRPIFSGDDEAMARRIKLIPFEVRIPEVKRDPNLIQRLQEELPGILNWAIAGYSELESRGLREPAKVRKATAEYLGEMDTVGSFIAECCDIGPEKSVPAGTLHHAYQYWCHDRELSPLGQTRVAQILTQRNFQKRRRRINGKTTREWRGLAVIDDAIPPPNSRPV